MIKATFVGITTEKEYPKVVNFSDFDEVIIKTECPSIYERYIQASKARNEIVYVQDDDCIVDYNELFKQYNGELTNAMTLKHHEHYKPMDMTLVGWGCFFPKKALINIGKYASVYGVDAHLMREADRIFTYLTQPHNTIIMPHEDLPQINRMSNTDPMHYEYVKQVWEKLKLIPSPKKDTQKMV